MDREELYTYLSDVKHVALATVEGRFPRVRHMNFVCHRPDKEGDPSFWLVSYGKDAKVDQISAFPHIEICAVLEDGESLGSARLRGQAAVCEDMQIKTEIRPSIWFFDRYFGSIDDPNFVLLKLAPSEITCQHPKLKTFHTFPIAPQQ